MDDTLNALSEPEATPSPIQNSGEHSPRRADFRLLAKTELLIPAHV
jgi:hypothetical protein